MNTCVVCHRPLDAGEAIICAQCVAPESAAQGGQVLAPCVVCHTPTRGTYGGEFAVCLRCYATGRLTEEHIARYGRHTEAP
jgi:hypothetical protein